MVPTQLPIVSLATNLWRPQEERLCRAVSAKAKIPRSRVCTSLPVQVNGERASTFGVKWLLCSTSSWYLKGNEVAVVYIVGVEELVGPIPANLARYSLVCFSNNCEHREHTDSTSILPYQHYINTSRYHWSTNMRVALHHASFLTCQHHVCWLHRSCQYHTTDTQSLSPT